jgi:hypothetical protein
MAIDPISLGLTGASLLSGLFSNRPRTTTTESTSNMTGTQSSAGSTRRYMTPEMQQAMQLLAQFSMDRIANPMEGVDALLAPQRNAINANYSAMPQRVADLTMAGNGGMSGKFTRGVRQSEMARVGALADVNAQAPGLAEARRNTGLQSLLALLGINMGSDESSNSNVTQNTTSTGKQTGNGNMLGGAIDGAGGMAAYLYGLGKKK